MRLSNLKLSGFKSFADSSTLQFKANRTAVVGPNGCGKSNVIDAIRWVMGESSARQLRGGSMQDVIFTGTAKRKPVGMASVELRFENTYGKLGGAYNAYTELAVRRQVTREGKSEYFLNGTKCRRRDITDIFLGTGLGPRSYAIIEQGMINRLVDAKPDEMRVYIEEAAGISRYQARRRETLQHLEHTTQNLSRLDDIATELKAQLKSLKRQAETALQYKSLAQEIRSLKIEILSFQCEKSQRIQQEYSSEMTDLGEQFKLVRSELSTVEHDLSSTSELFQRLIQQSAPLQNEWQQAEKKRSELSNSVEQQQSLLQQNTENLVQLEQQKLHTKERIQLIDLQLETLLTQQESQAETLQSLEGDTQQASQNFSDLKAQQLQAQQEFSEIKAQVEQQQQQHLHMLAQTEQLNKNMQRIEQQKQTLIAQSSQIQDQFQDQDVEQLALDKARLQLTVEDFEQRIAQSRSKLESDQSAYNAQKSHISSLKSEIQVLVSEQKNLKQLMVKVSDQSERKLTQLMQVLTLCDSAKPYANLIEKFLSRWLSAHLVDVNSQFLPQTARQLKASIDQPQVEKIQLGQLLCLADWIESPSNSLWRQVAVVEHLQQGLDQQANLQAGQSMLSLDGYHIGQDWVVGLFFDESSQSAQGALSHRIRLDEIGLHLLELQPKLIEAEAVLTQLNTQIIDLKQQIQRLELESKQQRTELQQRDVMLAKQQSTLQALQLQKQQLAQQLQQLTEQVEEDAMQKDDLEIDMHALKFKLEQNLPAYQTQQLRLDELNDQAEGLEQSIRLKHQDLEGLRRLNLQNQQQIELLEKDISFLKAQYQQILHQIEQSKQCVDPIQLQLPSLKSQFDEQVSITEKLQKTWSEWQLELNNLQSKQQQLTELRHQYQQRDETVRNQLEEKRLAWQAEKSDLQHYAEQLKELNSEIIEHLSIDIISHQSQLESSQQRFEKIGAVNLAASEEYEEVLKRFEELSHQIEDLEKTVEQLKGAMKSIDQETKKLFMTTFDQVNKELAELFPKVFNGGEANLSLEDDWQSGVKLMARPPGKRNSSLALLSGGEKALTALALVFAIFRLNPAPFCVLDEVDAPLDDANVGRFCNLVKELSEQVQFIYITHNKVAMTMATDLLGVTMPEPGTSKLVTVNLEDAKEYGLVAES